MQLDPRPLVAFVCLFLVAHRNGPERIGPVRVLRLLGLQGEHLEVGIPRTCNA